MIKVFVKNYYFAEKKPRQAEKFRFLRKSEQKTTIAKSFTIEKKNVKILSEVLFARNMSRHITEKAVEQVQI